MLYSMSMREPPPIFQAKKLKSWKCFYNNYKGPLYGNNVFFDHYPRVPLQGQA